MILRPICGQAQETISTGLELRLQIMGTWISDATKDVCSDGSKPNVPTSLIQTRAKYEPNGTFSVHFFVREDGQSTLYKTMEGTYKVLLADFEGAKVPAIQYRYESETKGGKTTDIPESGSLAQLMIMMEKPRDGEKSSLFMSVPMKDSTGKQLTGPHACPPGERLCVAWTREGSE